MEDRCAALLRRPSRLAHSASCDDRLSTTNFPVTQIRLLSTDFDGTLVDHEANPHVSPALFEAFTALRSQGVLWAVNTGRVLWHIDSGLEEYKFPISPDFVLTSEREVFHRNESGKWQDYGDWNTKCAADHDWLFSQASPLLADIHARFDREPWAHFEYDGDRMVGIVTETSEEMDRVCEFLERERLRVPGFNFMRNTIYLRFCHEAYSKGTALGELARLLGIGREAIFAAGDHYNDLPMLDGRFAQWVACPANACDPVKRQVQEAGGYIAKGECSHGIVEALRHFGAI
jgi:HAD superfamily hydrolase (TIGR01484 family)